VNNLVEIIRVLETTLAAIAIIRGMLLINVLLERLSGVEAPSAVFAVGPMLVLFMLQACSAGVGGPAGVAPATFNLVSVSVAVVEMVTDTIRIKVAATTPDHLVKVGA